MAGELEGLLQQLRSEGTPDSSGRFTLDRFRAQALLGNFQKGKPEHYLFHIVRAGVAARSQRIQVLATPESLEVRFFGPAPLAFEERLIRSLDSPWGIPQGSALAHLARGILASAELSPHRLEWNTWEGKQGSQMLWDDRGLSVGRLNQSPWRDPRSGFSFLLQGALRDAEREKTALQRNYGFTSIPLMLGERVSEQPGWLDPELCSGGDERLPAGFRLAEAYGPPGPRLQLHLPATQGRARMTMLDGPAGVVEEPSGHWQPALEQPLIAYSPSTRAQGSASAVAIAWHLSGEGRVIWIQNGLRLSELSLDMGCPGSVAVSEVDGLTLDVGGTQIVHDRVYQNRVRDLRESIKTLWPSIPKYLPLLQLRSAPRPNSLAAKLFRVPEATVSADDRALQKFVSQHLPRYQP